MLSSHCRIQANVNETSSPIIGQGLAFLSLCLQNKNQPPLAVSPPRLEMYLPLSCESNLPEWDAVQQSRIRKADQKSRYGEF